MEYDEIQFGPEMKKKLNLDIVNQNERALWYVATHKDATRKLDKKP